MKSDLKVTKSSRRRRGKSIKMDHTWPWRFRTEGGAKQRLKWSDDSIKSVFLHDLCDTRLIVWGVPIESFEEKGFPSWSVLSGHYSREWSEYTVVSKLITDRDFFWGEFISNYRYRIALQEKLSSITETDLWEFQQNICHYRYRFSLEFQLISVTDTDFGLKAN